MCARTLTTSACQSDVAAAPPQTRGGRRGFKLCWRRNNEGSQLPGKHEGTARRAWGGPRAPERWNRGETGNEFPETGNKALSQSVTHRRGRGRGAAAGGGPESWRCRQPLGCISRFAERREWANRRVAGRQGEPEEASIAWM